MPVRSLRDGTIVLRVDDDGAGSEGTVTVDIEEGDLSYVERRPVDPILDRGALSHFRPAEDESVSLGFSMKFQSFTKHVDPSPHDVLTQQGGASAWLSQETDSDPWAIDLVFTVTDPAGGSSEVISFDRFHPEEIAFSEAEPHDTLVVSGRGFKRAFLMPDQIPGLFAWFDANSITGLADGEVVATWDDRSNNENDLTQSEAAEKPTYQTNEINSLPIVRFDGMDDNMERTLGSTFVQPYTILAVMKHVSGSVTTDEHMIGGLSDGASESATIMAQQATPDQVAHAVYRAVVYHQNVIDHTPMWRLIMLTIRLLPEFFFKKCRI
ncbi:MAG: hypothetical protein IIB38_00810 [Candidatus Hydrogenedentes bacterium]|nr:hypothetical protein [Candidatus Hydrogenedentota bacterium]